MCTSCLDTNPPSSLFLQEPIRPLEKRALNFLVNEYLLKNNYKLSSITFSDENDDQVTSEYHDCDKFLLVT